MATRQSALLKVKGNHEVGNLNSISVKTLAGGAIVTSAPIDNFTIVELGFDSEGNRTCKQLATKTTKGYLIASPEDRLMGEALVDFYNEIGEHARIVILEAGYTRFDTSAFTLNTGVSAIVNGLVAHFDIATKKYILSAAGSAHADYATSKDKFTVVSNEADLDYSLGKVTVKLEVTPV